MAQHLSYVFASTMQDIPCKSIEEQRMQQVRFDLFSRHCGYASGEGG
jgi:hypothetical protein